MLSSPPNCFMGILTSILVSHSVLADPSPANWPSFRLTPTHSATAPESITPPLRLLWTVAARDSIMATPVIGNRTIYIGSLDKTLMALDLETGSNRWTRHLGDGIEGSVLYTPTAIYVGDHSGILNALNPQTGGTLWTGKTGSKITASPALSSLGILLVGSFDSRLYAFSALTGQTSWIYTCTSYLNGTPATIEEKAIFGSCDGYLRVIDIATGKLIREMNLESFIPATPVVVDRQVIACTVANGIGCLDWTTGQTNWFYAPSNTQWMGAPACDGRMVVAGAKEGRLHAIDLKTGHLIWSASTPGDLLSSPIIAGQTILIADEKGTLSLFSLDKGQRLWSYSLGTSIRGSPALSDSKVIIGTDDGRILAFSFKP